MSDDQKTDKDLDQDIKDTDIIFDCPLCGKSLAIDYRGAGLSIPCTDCGKNVQVPIPAGMDISDLDSTDEEQEIRIINLRNTLADSKDRVRALEVELSELNRRRTSLESGKSDSMYRFGTIVEEVDIMRKHLQDIATALEKISAEASKRVKV